MLAYTEHANPALFSYLPKHFNFDMPNIQIYTQNVSISDLRNNFSNVPNGGVNSSTSNNIGTLAQTFGNKTIQFGVGGDVGFSFGGLVVGASGGAVVMAAFLTHSWLQTSTPAN